MFKLDKLNEYQEIDTDDLVRQIELKWASVNVGNGEFAKSQLARLNNLIQNNGRGILSKKEYVESLKNLLNITEQADEKSP